MPIESLATVSPSAVAADIEDLCARTGFSRFPVMSTTGALNGYLHIKDVLETDEERRLRRINPKWIRPLATVRADDLLHDALETLQTRGAHMARVVRPDGTLLGVATLEDVLEELVGEIRDGAHHAQHAPGADHSS
jgi:CBS domain containing-hemolysin-like protein